MSAPHPPPDHPTSCALALSLESTLVKVLVLSGVFMGASCGPHWLLALIVPHSALVLEAVEGLASNS